MKKDTSESITYENIKRITFQKPQANRDRRGGLWKLREMIFFLRDFGFKEKQPIPYTDVEHSIMEISQGTDPRTVKKYLGLLVKFGYLKPVGHPISKNTRITVMFNEKVNAKTYYSKKGYSTYVFGIMAPKRYAATALNVESVPPDPPLPSVNEELSKMLDRVGVTSKSCVCVGDGDSEESGEAEENVEDVSSRKKRRRRDYHTHIYRNQTTINTSTAKKDHQNPENTEIDTFTAKRNTQGCFIKKPRGGS